MGFVYGCLIFLIVSLCYLDIEGRTFLVSNYSAYPNDNIDDTSGIQNALNDAASYGRNNIVLFESGTYDCFGGFTIYGATNLTIMGQGMYETLLLGHRPSGMFWIQGINTMLISSLSIDYDPLPFTAGYVVNATSTYLDVQIVPPHRPDINRQVSAILRYDPTLMRPAIGSRAYEVYQTPPNNANTTLVSNGVLRIPVAWQMYFGIGDAIVARYVSTGHVISGQSLTNITIKSVTIYTGWYMALTFKVAGLNVIDFHVKPRAGRWLSTSADCMHFGDARNYINIFNSSCEGQGDDGLNVHAYYYKVTEIFNSTALTLTEYNWPEVLNVGVGTNLEFVSGQQPFVGYATATIVSLTGNGGNSKLFIFANPINASVGDWAVVADTPTVTIRNFTAANNRARGILLQARNITVTQSLFNQTSGPAVLFGASLYWHEGPTARNVTLDQNVYISCNEGIAQGNGVISISPDLIAPVPVITNIQITSSTFLNGQYSKYPIQSSNGGGVSIRNNYFSMKNYSNPIVILCNSQNISAFNNTVISNASVISQFVTYASTGACNSSLSSYINLPDSAFNASFRPPVIATSLGVQINNF
ncbi:unnamed protein product [Adineta ricciae]|uniref:Pectate lyase superfamily protein domain-containing protein n=1 Tax=Adineta ricciae TaxID=249248 RepID=A0A814XSP2_ADIRI|nr:unnamed protein product [Adineta ricciae]CAF1489363.1 unnamed protein product [Adineta ricciae]